MIMTPPASSSQTNTQYVLVFWSNLFQDQNTVTFIHDLKNMGINVKVIDAENSDRKRHEQMNHLSPLSADTTLEEALALLPNAACVVLPHDWQALDLVLSHPKYGLFMRMAAESDAHLVGCSELVAMYALNRVVEKSFDWVYPLEQVDIGPFMNNVVSDIEQMLK